MNTAPNFEVTGTDTIETPVRVNVGQMIEGGRNDTLATVQKLAGPEMQGVPSLADALDPKPASAPRSTTAPKEVTVPAQVPPITQPEAVSSSSDGPGESVGKGAVFAGLATGAAVSTLPIYAGSLVGPGLLAATTGTLPLTGAGIVLGVPAATGAAGWFMGKKLGHPVAGAAIGTAAGAGGVLSAAPLVGAFQTGATFGEAAIIGGLGSAATAGSLAIGGGVAAGVGAGLYGLGRWHGHVWQSKPGGILKTMARGVVAPLSVPWGYMRSKRYSS